MSVKISAVIISKNEVDRIGDCIQSLKALTDDIIVVDSGSTDGTQEKARSLGATVVETGWIGYGANKNFGHTKTQNDWILSIDADESLSAELVEEIQSTSSKQGIVYAIDRQNYYLGKRINYSGWSPDWVQRIFNKNEVKWNENLVHEKLVLSENVKVLRLKHKLIHNSYRSKEDHMAKIEKYASLRAQMWIDKNKTPNVFKRWLGPSFKAFKSYILKLGILDGGAGWNIAKMNAHLVKRQIYHFDKIKNSRS